MQHIYFMLAGLLLFLLQGYTLHAQSAEQRVISSGGSSSKAISGYDISFTIGETMIATIGNSPVCTEGFHQPSQAKDFPQGNQPLVIYPNPVKNTLFVRLFSDKKTSFQLTFYTITGQLAGTRKLDIGVGYNLLPVPVVSLKQGIYIVSVKDMASSLQMTVKMMKE
jgi:hypothetical protein